MLVSGSHFLLFRSCVPWQSPGIRAAFVGFKQGLVLFLGTGLGSGSARQKKMAKVRHNAQLRSTQAPVSEDFQVAFLPKICPILVRIAAQLNSKLLKMGAPRLSPHPQNNYRALGGGGYSVGLPCQDLDVKMRKRNITQHNLT